MPGQIRDLGDSHCFKTPRKRICFKVKDGGIKSFTRQDQLFFYSDDTRVVSFTVVVTSFFSSAFLALVRRRRHSPPLPLVLIVVIVIVILIIIVIVILLPLLVVVVVVVIIIIIIIISQKFSSLPCLCHNCHACFITTKGMQRLDEGAKLLVGQLGSAS